MAATDRTILAQAARTGDTVFVACKYPNGVKLDLFDPKDEYEMTPQGRKPMKVYRRNGKTFTVRGPRLAHGQMPTFPIISGFAITPGCPREHWEKYAEQNREADLIVNYVLFAAPTLEAVTSMCREHAKVQSGFQPLDMVTKKTIKNADGEDIKVIADPRVPGRSGGVTGITTADDASANKPDAVPVDG